MMLGLAVTPRPYPDESLVGYLYRLADLNAVTGGEVLKAFRAMSANDTDAWLTADGAPPTWYDECRELRQPSTRSARAWNFRSRKFCPLCLDEGRYWRAGWHLMLVTCCTRHQVELHDRCSACGNRFAAECMRSLCCTLCGEPLTKQRTDPSSMAPGALWLADQLTRRVAKSKTASRHISGHLTLPDFHELALRLGVRDLSFNRNKPLKLRDAGALEIAYPIADRAGSALMVWPRGFFLLLDTIRDQCSRPSNWKIAQSLGPIYQDIYRHLAQPQFNFVREGFESYVHERWDAPLALRNRNFDPELVRRHRWVSIPEAAEKVGVDPALLQRMAEHNELPVREVEFQSGRTGRVVDFQAVEPQADRLLHAMTLEQVAARLGLAEKRIRQLLEGDVLTVIGGSPRAGERWWVDPISLESIKPGRSLSGVPADQVTVAHLAKFLISDGNEFVAFIRAIQSGDLPVLTPVPTDYVGSWLLDKEDVTSWRTGRQEGGQTKYSIMEAAVQLGVKQEVAYALVRAGLLPVVMEAAGRRTAQWVIRSALDQFQRQFVFGVELAKEMQTSPKKLAQIMSTAGIQAAAGPDIDSAPCRQYVWHRTRKLYNFTSKLQSASRG